MPGSLVVMTLLQRQGRVAVQFPSATGSGTNPISKIYDVRAWPDSQRIVGSAISAGVGDLTASIETSLTQVHAGQPVLLTVRLTGLAAIGAETTPGIVIRNDRSQNQAGAAFETFLVRQSLDWGNGADRPPERTWAFEWRPLEPGEYRVEPVRITYLDPNGRVQTRLVTARRIQVEPRTLFRASPIAPVPRSPNEPNGTRTINRFDPGTWLVFGTIGLILAGVGIGLGRSRWLLRMRLSGALRRASTKTQALKLWRTYEHRVRERSKTDHAMAELRDELERRAFGR